MKNKKKIYAAGMVAVVVIVIVVACVILKGNAKRTTENGSLQEKYAMAIPSGDKNITSFNLKFDLDKHTYAEEVGEGEKAVALESGSYTDSGNVVTVKSDSDEEKDSVDYLIAGDYLIVDGYFYDGEVPDGEHFDTVCSFADKYGVTYTITFKADGTYEEVTEDTRSTETDGSNVSNATGTYDRDGDIIKRKADDGSCLIDFLIYKGQLTNSYYIAEK